MRGRPPNTQRILQESGADIDQDSIILLDCLTTLLDNELFGPGLPLEEEFLNSVFSEIITGINEIRKTIQLFNCREQ
ncbi:hypothetical protein RCO48_12075 [Peribacillus frigoritolerans]|nr:hypothetical protein [Peribacillus frigoritolerans]